MGKPGISTFGDEPGLGRVSRRPTTEARDRPVITAFRLLAVLNVGFKNVGARHAVPAGAERRPPCTGGPLTHFASPRGEKNGLATSSTE